MFRCQIQSKIPAGGGPALRVEMLGLLYSLPRIRCEWLQPSDDLLHMSFPSLPYQAGCPGCCTCMQVACRATWAICPITVMKRQLVQLQCPVCLAAVLALAVSSTHRPRTWECSPDFQRLLMTNGFLSGPPKICCCVTGLWYSG